MEIIFNVLKILSSLLLSIYTSSFTVTTLSYIASTLIHGESQIQETEINSIESVLSLIIFFINFLILVVPILGIVIIGPYIVGPCLAFITITEVFKIIKKKYYILFGALLGSTVILIIKWETTWAPAQNFTVELAGFLLIFAFSGALSGWVYWHFAGKNAGRFWPQPNE